MDDSDDDLHSSECPICHMDVGEDDAGVFCERCCIFFFFENVYEESQTVPRESSHMQSYVVRIIIC